MVKSNVMLITGCGGMLGEAAFDFFKDKYKVFATDINVNEKWLSYLDVNSLPSLKKICDKINPNFIVHLVGLTDLEYCESNPEKAYQINTWGLYNVVAEARRRSIPIVHISTAGVFDGLKKFYSEDNLPNPINVYGKSKYLSELIALSYNKAIVIRAGWMMGGGPKKDKKFINKIVKQLNSGVKEIKVINDKMGSPSYTYDLVKIIYFLLRNKKYGLYHGCCKGSGSRLDVAKQIVSILKMNKKVKIKVVNSQYFSNTYFVPRPASENLVNSKLNKIGVSLTRHWNDALKDYLGKFDWLSNT